MEIGDREVALLSGIPGMTRLMDWATAPFHDRPNANATQRIQSGKRNTKKRLIDSVAISKTAVAAYYLPIRLKGLLILQSARGLVGCENML